MKKLILITLFCIIALCYSNSLTEVLDEVNQQFAAVDGGFAPTEVMGPNEAVQYARAQVGKGYSQSQCTGAPNQCCRLGPKCFDCSGLVYKAWEKGGKKVPLTTHGYPSSGFQKITALNPNNLRAGDVMYRDGHVGLYDGAGHVIQAANSKTGVIRTPLADYVKWYGATCAYRP